MAVGLLATSGCRTYGGYGSESKTFEALQTTVESFESDLDQEETELRMLEDAATGADTLQPFAEEFRGLVEKHKSLLQKQRQRVDRLSPESSYRELHRAYGATVTEQRLMRKRYQRITKNVRLAVQGSTEAQASSPDTERSYTFKPIGFPDSNSKGDLSMEEALQGR